MKLKFGNIKKAETQPKNHTILIVDDEIGNLNATANLLSQDYKVFTASSGKTALEIIESLKDEIQLIISDQRMPEMNGVEFLKKTKELIPDAVRFILTGYTDVNSIIESINVANIYKLLVKPIEPEELLITIQRAFETYELKKKNLSLVDELKTLNIELEKKVEEKTRDLQNSLDVIRNDLIIAQKIQQKILPERVMALNNVKIITQYLPMMEVGGDLFFIKKFNENYFRIFIADATGHGVQAALVTMVIKTEYDELNKKFISPDRLLFRLNNQYTTKFYSTNSFFSCAILDLDFKNRRILYSSAGHPDQIYIQEGKLNILSTKGRYMGIVQDSSYTLLEKKMEKGKIFLFTDGVYEQFNESSLEYGAELLYEFLLKQQDSDLELSINNLIEEVKVYTATNGIQDDITIIGIQIMD